MKFNKGDMVNFSDNKDFDLDMSEFCCNKPTLESEIIVGDINEIDINDGDEVMKVPLELPYGFVDTKNRCIRVITKIPTADIPTNVDSVTVNLEIPITDNLVKSLMGS